MFIHVYPAGSLRFEQVWCLRSSVDLAASPGDPVGQQW